MSQRAEIENLALRLLTQSFGEVDFSVPGFGGRDFASVCGAALEDRQFALRPLSIAAPLLSGSERPIKLNFKGGERNLRDWFVERISTGYNPSHPAFFGFPEKAMDQRIVELAFESIAFAQNPALFWEELPESCRAAFVRMADLALDHFTLSINNWNLFPVVIHLGLKQLGLPWDRAAVLDLLREVENMYKGDGWYADGYHRQFDYYVAWEMQALGLLAAKWLEDECPELWEKAAGRAQRFAESYDLFFDREGRHVPFGRSLCYRYSAATFWGMAAWLEVPGLNPQELVSKTHANLMAMARMSEGMRPGDPGFTYPQPLLPEPYAAAGGNLVSHAFQVLAFGHNHPIWNGEYGLSPFASERIRFEEVPNLLLVRHAEGCSSTLLNQGVMHPFDFGNHPAKYSKFAYSSHFGFNLASSAFASADNMISASLDGVTWSHRFHFQPLPRRGDWLLSRHRPFAGVDGVEIVTALTVWKQWHVRLHLVHTDQEIELREGGFPVAALEPPPLAAAPSGPARSFVSGRNGLCGLVGLSGPWSAHVPAFHPNVNVYARTSAIPLLHCHLPPGCHALAVAVYESHAPVEPESFPDLIAEGTEAWSIRWPDGEVSGAVQFANLPAYQLPGTQGKPWSRPAVR